MGKVLGCPHRGRRVEGRWGHYRAATILPMAEIPVSNL